MDGSETVDGTEPFRGDRAHVHLYDLLYGAAADRLGDLDHYAGLASAGRGRILDAACGTGRIFSALAEPGRSICAFDASDELLRVARNRAEAISDRCVVEVRRDRLESFGFGCRFDLVIVGFYGFSYLLRPRQRADCLARIGAHLDPQGRAVLHLPDPGLLDRPVPGREIAALSRSVRVERAGWGEPVDLALSVAAMDYDPDSRIRSVTTDLRVSRANGDLLVAERSTMRYARVDSDEIEGMAGTAGLAVESLAAGFTPDARGELVVTLRSR